MLPTLRVILFILLATTAASAQWQLHDAHTTADLRGIDNVGSGVAWASGSDGTILRTEDAGIVWQLCAKPPNGEHLDFRAIQASDNNTAIIMSIGKGDQSRLYKTIDGCQTWKLLFTNPDKDGFFDALQFEPPPNPGAPPSTGAAGQGGVGTTTDLSSRPERSAAERPAFGTTTEPPAELILATSPTVEGEATARYLADEAHARFPTLTITRIATGVPAGSDIEYADEVTMTRALENRRSL